MPDEATDLIQLYSLESWLFRCVGPRFRAQGFLKAFDFFAIVIWKANRAKSKIARQLISRDPMKRTDLDAIVRTLTEQIFQAPNDAARLKLMREEWGFRLPMASAVLTVFYPDNFTVYDVRVCAQIGGHRYLDARRAFDSFWKGYQGYIKAVREHSPAGLTLRDMDRYLWGKSFAEGLRQGISSGFSEPVIEDEE